MAVIKLYGRERELALLGRLKPPFLAVVYGRRRIGKTALVLSFISARPHLYFFVNPKKPRGVLLEEFGEALRRVAGLPSYVRFADWEEFFDVLFQLRGYVVAFDEFQWFLETAPEVPYILQKMWDTRVEKPSVILTGSVVGMVKRLVAEAGSPLFGRADLVLELGELEPPAVFRWLGDMGVVGEEAFKLFLLFGGVPYYYRLAQQWGVKTAEDAVRLLVAGEGGPLRHEVEFVLAESLGREYRTHLAILDAVAGGATKLEQIASRAGVKATSLPPYLNDLVNLLGVLERRRSKRVYYEIRDRFYAYWLRSVYRHGDVAAGEALVEAAVRELERFYPWAFEAAVRQILPRFYPVKKVSREVVHIREGGRRVQLDVDALGVDEERRFAVLAEAKWGAADPREIVPKLRKAAEMLIPPGWTTRLAIFAKSFTAETEEADLIDLGTILQNLAQSTPSVYTPQTSKPRGGSAEPDVVGSSEHGGDTRRRARRPGSGA
ncbi:ATP-binding protein [Pyrobaculum sp. 3827-6]|uniref:ATP-binding protein n=1 Tax=Pyrobaculum sp. 3827-6 TaxID=2983604 RepID=UPI0021D8E15D|nr:ATP-binding protein [Pyrobaculum sp. 3827-6]MCU7786891.1 ATP-binding protein [Pyrobaculum sp. 3827-6]